MANILLTTLCNLRCGYCFARERMVQKPSQTMSMENVEKVIDFLKRSDYPIFRMMGGEPTLHPHFPDIVKLALNEGMRIDLLTNATWDAEYNQLFARISPNSLLFLLNIDHPENYPSRLWTAMENNLNTLAGRKGVSLSFNIFEKEPKYEYIFDLTTTYEIRRIRLSFSLPVIGEDNAHLDIHEYDEMATFIMDFVRRAEDRGVGVQLDNAIPLCMFTYEQVGELILKGVLDLTRNARCRPIIDIGPDLTVWCCFCLSTLCNRRLDEFETLGEIQDYYSRFFKPYQTQVFALDKCYDCSYRTTWECQGGCTAFSVALDGNLCGNDSVDNNVHHDRCGSGSILALADDVTIDHYEIPKESYVLRNAAGHSVEVNASFKRLLDRLDGHRGSQQVVNEFLNDEFGHGDHDPVAAFERRVMEEGFTDLLLALQKDGLIVLER
ncbi:MAG: radical SAM protein [Phycisphaerales bacterium]|nr:MAG: radical SAM protein [Phycisphaerales bacterium]